MNAIWVYLAIGLYIVVGMAVAFAARRGLGQGGHSMVDFFLANRTLGPFVNALTYSATTYSAFMMVGLAGLTYQAGVGAMGVELIYLSGLMLAVFFGPRFWLAAKERGYVTPAEMLGDRYESRAVAAIAALASIIFLIPFCAVQLMGIAYLMQGLSKGVIPFAAGVILATLLAVAWVWIGGLRSVAWTDALQAMIMMVTALSISLFVVYGEIGGFGKLFARLGSEYPKWLTVPGPGYFKFRTFLGLALPWLFYCVTMPHVSQRLFVPASLRGMRGMVVGFCIFGFIYTVISITWGFAARVLLPNLPNADMATPTLLGSTSVPLVLALIAMVGITSAAVSTVDSVLLTVSSLFARDIYGNLKAGASEARQLQVGHWVIPIMSVAALLFAFLKLDLIAVLSIASAAGLLVTMPAIFGTFFWKRGTAAGTVASMVVGAVLVIWFELGKLEPLGLWPGVWGLIVAAVLFVVVSAVTEPPKGGAAFVDGVNATLREKNVL
ncbi:Sodium/solute symporter [Moorella glycerini]|uniref:Sodium/pantothenate symporter n=1 Tax=Neomoorella stamsii TaxID=1266720 RepID=A0A9X7P6E4_9FIRM|nr:MULTISPECIES: sodium:solute symporter family protein [Moorella]PRR73418.1 Sodium/pantothenate symporter [Moorella stamsii]CEP69187.1 Sodium/solute symporter [Moorella glycerini]